LPGSRSATKQEVEALAAWIVFVLGVLGVALIVAYAANRWIGPSHATVDVSGLDLPAGLTVFTSTDCSDCSALMGMLRGVSVPVREVTFELEPGRFEKAGVDGVPLLVAVDDQGRSAGQLAGLPRRRALERLLRTVA
jgi:hypothetical protein